MEANFSDYINDAVRVLVLLNAVKERKSMKVTEHKIKLYDYYLKFPCTMLSDDLIVYRITDLGIEALNDINSSYRDRLVELANCFIPKVQRLSDTKIEQIIREKSKTCLKSGGVNYESQNKA